jgi:hypothetical protein
VTRAEYEELKAQFDELRMIVHRLLPQESSSGAPAIGSLPYYPMSSSNPTLVGTHGVPESGHQPYQTSMYSSIMAPPSTYPPHHLDSTSPPLHRYSSRPEESQSPRHHASGSGAGASSLVSSMQPGSSGSQSRSSGSSSRIASDHKSPGTSGGGGATSAGGAISTGLLGGAGSGSSSGGGNGGARHSPLSLTSITGPSSSGYGLSDSLMTQSKNFHAQTLTLGERLRHDRPILLEGPAFLTPLTPIQLVSRTIPARRASRSLLRSRRCTLTGMARRFRLLHPLPRPPSSSAPHPLLVGRVTAPLGGWTTGTVCRVVAAK